MLRFERREMSAVNRQNSSNVQSFRHRHNYRVNQINVVIVVPLQNFGGAFQISVRRAFDIKIVVNNSP